MAYPNTNRLPSISYPNGESYSFDGEVSQPSIDPSQWNYQRRSSAQHLVASPSMSMHSMITMSSPSSYHPSQFHQADLSSSQVNIGSNMTSDIALLAPPSHFSQPSYDPIARQFQEQPWSVNNPRTVNAGSSRSPSNQSQVHFRPYREPGINLGGSDSAYYSQSQPACSVLSNEPDCYNQDLSPSVTLQVEGMNVGSPTIEAPAISRTHSEIRSQVSSRSGKSGKSSRQIPCIPCPDPDCLTVSKCMSEHKKHMLRHLKPYKCEEPNCKRDGEGFTTSNDLERHKKSVHRIGLRAGSFQCASKKCKNPHKIWPRLDNFKQHIERMHKDEDHIKLVKKSEFHPEESTDRVEPMTVAPGDTSFDVAGMDRSLSANPAMDNVPAMDIPLVEHNPIHWSSWDQNAHNLAQRVAQSSTPRSDPTPQKVTTGTCRVQRRILDEQKPSQGNAQQSLAVPGRRSAQLRSNAGGCHNRQPGPTSVLSNAPQTKAEQQMSALSKFSQTRSSSPGSVDLVAFLMNMVQQATDPAKWDSKAAKQQPSTQSDGNIGGFTKTDALHAVQAISNLIKQSSGASSSRVQRRMTQGLASNAKACPFLKCGFAVARDCDLRKHMKRHERPYGCTYPKCYKRFGAKSDYKRHENSQHFQLEAWRCLQVDELGKRCGAHFFRGVQYEQHLQDQHKELSREKIEQLLGKNRIGKNCQVRFWCGFCNDIIRLHQRRNAAWDERFDHIAKHFEKEKKSIDDWICVEENKPKKELCQGMDRDVFDEDEEQNIDAEGEDDDEDAGTQAQQAFSSHASSGSGKRQASDGLQAMQRPQKRRNATVVNRYCCSCGGSCGSFDVECLACAHSLCLGCNYVEDDVVDMFK